MAVQTGKSPYDRRKEARRALVEQRREERLEKQRRRKQALAGVVLLAAVIAGGTFYATHRPERPAAFETMEESAAVEAAVEEVLSDTETPEPVDEETVMISFAPHAAPSTDPVRYIQSTELSVVDLLAEEAAEEADTGTEETTESEEGGQAFTPWYYAFFGRAGGYTGLEGITTFRGNNFRDTAAWGNIQVESRMLTENWTQETGSLTYQDKAWTGSGWTGQPLIVKWPKETKAVMNLYDWAKEDDDLVEVIYACLDGNIYFLDLVTGKPTRKTLEIGYTFKGSGSLDPRGYPILYVGSGYTSYNGRSRAFIISLIDGSILYTFGNADEFSDRSSVSFFDAAPLVDAEDDTLIWPGENGILYLLRLNTHYNEAAGTLSVEPDRMAKWKYTGTRTEDEKFWLGMEDSPAAYGGYLFVADNGGNLICLSLNSLQPVWVQDTLDDTNCTPVLSVEDGHLYLYISTSFHLGWRSSYMASVPIWKLDAETGEIVWQTEYACHSEDGVSGGVQSTIAPGKNGLSDYLYVTVSMTKDTAHGVLACLNKETGEIVWEQEAAYAWSSPVCVYEEDGSGMVLYCTSAGTLYLLDGLNGKDYEDHSLGQCTVEASPAVYGNYVVIGTRDCRIVGLELK